MVRLRRGHLLGPTKVAAVVLLPAQWHAWNKQSQFLPRNLKLKVKSLKSEIQNLKS